MKSFIIMSFMTLSSFLSYCQDAFNVFLPDLSLKAEDKTTIMLGQRSKNINFLLFSSNTTIESLDTFSRMIAPYSEKDIMLFLILDDRPTIQSKTKIEKTKLPHYLVIVDSSYSTFNKNHIAPINLAFDAKRKVLAKIRNYNSLQEFLTFIFK